MFPGKGVVDALHDKGIIQSILKIICPAREACRQRDFQIQLNGLRGIEFPRVDSHQRFDLEFLQEDDVHMQ